MAPSGLTRPIELDNLSSSQMTLPVVLRRAIRQAPCSIRELARRAGVSHAMLAAVAAGSERATPRVATKVAGALEVLTRDCAQHAAALRTALGGSNRKEKSP